MKVGLIGLGRMGMAITERLIDAGHTVFAFDLNEEACNEARRLGAKSVSSIIELTNSVRIFWLMVPAGKIVDDVIDELLSGLQGDDIVIDGGNSNFADSVRRAQKLQEHNVLYLDCGTSGGLLGRDIGFSLMVGGSEQAYKKCEPLFEAVAEKNGFGLVGPSGAGHYVKMVHNGIEYALLQAYAEGFHVLKDGQYKDLNLEQISRIWMHGSVIRSWILDLCHNIFKHDQEFKDVSGEIGGGSTGTWTVQEAEKQNIPVALIQESLSIREKSRKTGGNYATKLVALLRNQFGGHQVKKIH